jgi:hypothetical protein
VESWENCAESCVVWEAKLVVFAKRGRVAGPSVRLSACGLVEPRAATSESTCQKACRVALHLAKGVTRSDMLTLPP